ncbi:uncharacterized protein LOC130138313 isoform X3 [Syzygium oleosum]|uniref:uncharacterized protein LOC130138313 isoform X3 n=1 Tax=Syzygium oleosum TaxID=219896 RepID=UPI0024BAF2FC|nr:uncharacterized protein LOC130138313 isoform X3 [Syzygium oleosum]
MFTFSSSSPTLLLNQIAAWSSPILDRFSSLLASISLLFAVVSSFQGFVVHKLQVRRRSSAPLGRPRRRGVVSLGGASVDRYCRRPEGWVEIHVHPSLKQTAGGITLVHNQFRLM